MNKKELSTKEIILKGYLWVNIPITIIIVLTWYLLKNKFNLENSISLLFGVVIGWIYWEFTIKKWVKWVLDNNVNEERLFKIGQLSLLLWSKSTINKTKESRSLEK